MFTELKKGLNVLEKDLTKFEKPLEKELRMIEIRTALNQIKKGVYEY